MTDVSSQAIPSSEVSLRTGGDSSRTVTDGNTWIKRLATPGAGLLSPVTTESTQKAGARLILTSALTILIVNGVIVVKGGEVGGLALEAAKFFYVVLIAGLACLYFLLLYVFDLFRDRKEAYYRRLSDLVELRRLRDEHNIEMNALVARQNEAFRLLELRRQKYDELLGQYPECPTLDASAPPEEFNHQMESVRQWRSEHDRRLKEWVTYQETDGLEELSVVVEEPLIARAKTLTNLIETSWYVDRIRWATEIIIPCGIGVVALVSAVWYLIGRWWFGA